MLNDFTWNMTGCLVITMMSSLLLISTTNIIVNLFVCAVFIYPSVFVRIH